MSESKKLLAIVGTNISHSLAPKIHGHVAESLSLPWTFGLEDTSDIAGFVDKFRQPEWVGAVITMPHKLAVIPLADEVDQHVTAVGACNGLWKKADGTVVGTNTDWIGIERSLSTTDVKGKGKPALIIGAGGACRAAVYALSVHLGCQDIYILNRDVGEVEALVKDVNKGYPLAGYTLPNIHHLQSVDDAHGKATPYYIVGTVPDFEAVTPSEKAAQGVLLHFLEDDRAEKGLLLDMCYKPRVTRHIKAAEENGWKTLDGVNIIAHQIESVWTLWAGADRAREVPLQEAKQYLYSIA